MKQHITIEQLKELQSSEKFYRLYRKIRPNGISGFNTLQNYYLFDLNNNRGFSFNKFVSEVTLGAMLEIIKTGKENVVIQYLSAPKVWNVMSDYVEEDMMWYIDEMEKELCDTFWEAIKKII